MQDEAIQIGANVTRLRQSKGLSQSALADQMREAGQDHWRQNTVSRVETGKQPIRPPEAVALEAVLGGSVLTGTKMAEPFVTAFEKLKSGLGDQSERAIIAYRLERIAAKQAELTQMINEFRYAYDEQFAAEHPEIGESDNDLWGMA